MKLRTLTVAALVAGATFSASQASANVSACYYPGVGANVNLSGFKAGDQFRRQIETFDNGVKVTSTVKTFVGPNYPFAISYPYQGPVTLSAAHVGSSPYLTINVPVCPDAVVPKEETPVSESTPVVDKTPVVKPKPKPRPKPLKPLKATKTVLTTKAVGCVPGKRPYRIERTKVVWTREGKVVKTKISKPVKKYGKFCSDPAVTG